MRFTSPVVVLGDACAPRSRCARAATPTAARRVSATIVCYADYGKFALSWMNETVANIGRYFDPSTSSTRSALLGRAQRDGRVRRRRRPLLRGPPRARAAGTPSPSPSTTSRCESGVLRERERRGTSCLSAGYIRPARVSGAANRVRSQLPLGLDGDVPELEADSSTRRCTRAPRSRSATATTCAATTRPRPSASRPSRPRPCAACASTTAPRRTPAATRPTRSCSSTSCARATARRGSRRSGSARATARSSRASSRVPLDRGAPTGGAARAAARAAARRSRSTTGSRSTTPPRVLRVVGVTADGTYGVGGACSSRCRRHRERERPAVVWPRRAYGRRASSSRRATTPARLRVRRRLRLDLGARRARQRRAHAARQRGVDRRQRLAPATGANLTLPGALWLSSPSHPSSRSTRARPSSRPPTRARCAATARTPRATRSTCASRSTTTSRPRARRDVAAAPTATGCRRARLDRWRQAVDALAMAPVGGAYVFGGAKAGGVARLGRLHAGRARARGRQRDAPAAGLCGRRGRGLALGRGRARVEARGSARTMRRRRAPTPSSCSRSTTRRARATRRRRRRAARDAARVGREPLVRLRVDASSSLRLPAAGVAPTPAAGSSPRARRSTRAARARAGLESVPLVGLATTLAFEARTARRRQRRRRRGRGRRERAPVCVHHLGRARGERDALGPPAALPARRAAARTQRALQLDEHVGRLGRVAHAAAARARVRAALVLVLVLVQLRVGRELRRHGPAYARRHDVQRLRRRRGGGARARDRRDARLRLAGGRAHDVRRHSRAGSTRATSRTAPPRGAPPRPAELERQPSSST